MSSSAKRESYHHGDLRTALVETAIDLIAERGVRGFSLAEASRRSAVSSGAPYKHFADRDELLAAIAGRACELLVAALAASEDPDVGPSGPTDPSGRLVRNAGTYVRCAAQHRPLFEALFAAGLDKSRYPDLTRAATPVIAAYVAPAQALSHDADGGRQLALAVVASAQGYVTLLFDGVFGDGPEAADLAVVATEAATAALVAGREALW